MDIYDIILSHLLDEGYAETQEAAQVMMVNMSEEWRGSIVEAFHPVYGRGGEQRRTQTSLQGLGKYARATDKKKLHNIPKGGTTISDRDPQGERLGTGEYDRGKGNKAKRRAASLQSNKPELKKSLPNRLRRADGQGIRDSYEFGNVEEVLDEKTATPPSKFNTRKGLDVKARKLRRSSAFYDDERDREEGERKFSTSKGEGGITKNSKKLRKQKAMGEHD